MKLLLVIFLLSFGAQASELCFVRASHSYFKFDFTIYCDGETKLSFKKSSTNKEKSYNRFMAFMIKNGFSYVGTFPRLGTLIFSDEATLPGEFKNYCIAHPKSLEPGASLDVFQIDCQDNTLVTLYSDPTSDHPKIAHADLFNQEARNELVEYMNGRGYELRNKFESNDKWIQIKDFRYLFQKIE